MKHNQTTKTASAPETRSSAPRGGVSLLQYARQVEIQRDELLAALKEIRELNRSRGKGRPIARACNRMDRIAETAIAKAEGSK